MLEISIDVIRIFEPWIIFISLCGIFYYPLKWAKRRKTGVVILMTFIQMIMPDPFAERTIKTVQMDKKQVQKEQENDVPK